MDDDYLKRGLERRVEASIHSFARETNAMISQMASKGALGSGATLRLFEEIALSTLNTWHDDAARFVFTVTSNHDHESAFLLDASGAQLHQKIVEYLRERQKNTGMPSHTVTGQLLAIERKLTSSRAGLLDDFEHGMQGSDKLNKDPVVTLVAHQTNSPGAIQQIGSGTFSQSALVQNYAPLIQAIDAAINSDEYKQLAPDQQLAFRDIADTLRDEAGKAQPDPGKLKRWGNRLLELGTDLGMRVATSVLAQVLTRIFVG